MTRLGLYFNYTPETTFIDIGYHLWYKESTLTGYESLGESAVCNAVVVAIARGPGENGALGEIPLHAECQFLEDVLQARERAFKGPLNPRSYQATRRAEDALLVLSAMHTGEGYI